MTRPLGMLAYKAMSGDTVHTEATEIRSITDFAVGAEPLACRSRVHLKCGVHIDSPNHAHLLVAAYHDIIHGRQPVIDDSADYDG